VRTLIYIVAHKDRAAAKASWSAFGKDPDWKAARDASQVDGRLITKIKRQYLTPTDFSKLK
jgi:hypothetical protein